MASEPGILEIWPVFRLRTRIAAWLGRPQPTPKAIESPSGDQTGSL